MGWGFEAWTCCVFVGWLLLGDSGVDVVFVFSFLWRLGSFFFPSAFLLFSP